MKTFALRVEDEFLAQFSAVAGMETKTTTDAIRDAMQEYMDKRVDLLRGQTEATLAEIDREAAAKKAAVTSLFGLQPIQRERRGRRA
jgi:hypothetical protein